jgi:hypothetical protein
VSEILVTLHYAAKKMLSQVALAFLGSCLANPFANRIQAGHSSKRLASRCLADWLSPERPPRWKRLVALDGSGKEVDAQPGAKVKVVAASRIQIPAGTGSGI